MRADDVAIVTAFMSFLDAGVCDVMMPDVKYVGGMRAMLDVAKALRRRGVEFSPHNPSGPVCHAESLQICSAAPLVEYLEIQYDETPLFGELVGNALPEPTAGVARIPVEPVLGYGSRAASSAGYRHHLTLYWTSRESSCPARSPMASSSTRGEAPRKRNAAKLYGKLP